MSRSRRSTSTISRPPPSGPPIRLDLSVNPYGVSLNVADAIAADDRLHLPAGERADLLRDRLAQQDKVSPDWVVLANGSDDLLTTVLRWRRTKGPMIAFPPTDRAPEQLATSLGIDVLPIVRSPRFELNLDQESVAGLPSGSTAYVQSPNDPTGTALPAADAVRLARGCEIVIIDERYSGYSPRSAVPLVREFDNVIVLRTLETWAGLAGFPLAYVIAPPRLAQQIAAFSQPSGIATASVVAGLATLDDLPHIRSTVVRIRAERGRLYRMLRKLNMVSVPYPSWSNFLLVRTERSNAGTIARSLARRDILVHHPDLDELRNRHLRISATLPEHTDALKHALTDMADQL